MRLRRPGRAPRAGTPADLLVVGLGNPGDEYARTRHNVGAETVELLAKRHGASLRKGKERARTVEVNIGGKRVALAVPLTFMNDSGLAVAALARRFGVEPDQIVIVHDELDLPTATLRVKSGGGLAGHNGLRSVSAHLHSDDFQRVRIGVDKPPSKDRGVDHVLRRFSKRERDEIDVTIEQAADAVEAIATDRRRRADEPFQLISHSLLGGIPASAHVPGDNSLGGQSAPAGAIAPISARSNRGAGSCPAFQTQSLTARVCFSLLRGVPPRSGGARSSAPLPARTRLRYPARTRHGISIAPSPRNMVCSPRVPRGIRAFVAFTPHGCPHRNSPLQTFRSPSSPRCSPRSRRCAPSSRAPRRWRSPTRHGPCSCPRLPGSPRAVRSSWRCPPAPRRSDSLAT